jgi:hypothetical protein
MTEEAINPFDVSGYSTDPNETQATTQSEGTELPQEPTTSESTETISTESTPVESEVETKVETPSANELPTEESTLIDYKWENENAKNIYDSLVSGNVSEIADILYEQKVLSEIDTMNESDIIKLKLAYDYPDLTPQEIEEEFASKYSVDKDFDKDLLSEDEVAVKTKQLEKQEKAVAREMKKDVREAREHLQSLKQDISFPDILSQLQQSQQTVNTEEIVNQYLSTKQQEQEVSYQQAREVFEKSIDDGLKNFEGFNINYKDEDVQFDGKYSLTQEDRTQLQETMKSFDLESFYGSRYYKDGKYDTKQIAEDIYLLQNKDKIVNSMVTQAVSKAKSDILKGIKNIDYTNSPKSSASANNVEDYDKMVGAMYSL